MTYGDYLGKAKDLGIDYSEMLSQKIEYEKLFKNLQSCKNWEDFNQKFREIDSCKLVYDFSKQILEEKGEVFSPLEAELNHMELLN
jgi:hypothetical protein